MRQDDGRALRPARPLDDDTSHHDEARSSGVRVAHEKTPGGVPRTVISRHQSAQCLICGERWSDGYPLALAARHARRFGHLVRGEYHAVYVYGNGHG